MREHKINFIFGQLVVEDLLKEKWNTYFFLRRCNCLKPQSLCYEIISISSSHSKEPQRLPVHHFKYFCSKVKTKVNLKVTLEYRCDPNIFYFFCLLSRSYSGLTTYFFFLESHFSIYKVKNKYFISIRTATLIVCWKL